MSSVLTVLKAQVLTDNTGRSTYLPAIFINEHGVLKSHLRYLRFHNGKSKTWMNASVKAIKLLLCYMDANEHCFATPQKMFAEFTDALRTGTCDKDGVDPSDLRWKPRNDAKNIVYHVTTFSDWLSEDSGGETELLNPKRKSTQYEYRLNLAAYHHKINRAFLSHTFDDLKFINNAKTSRNISYSNNKSLMSSMEPIYYFNEDDFPRLINEGFKTSSNNIVESKNYNIRNILITLLMHYGGLRVCEPFHLYLDDISEDPDRKGHALVKVHHPTDGIAPKYFRDKYKKNNANRREYLSQTYGLEPRWNHPIKSYCAGWKDPLLDSPKGKYFVVQWFPLHAGNYFFKLWKQYLKYHFIRPQKNRHPFAFTNKDGDPLSIFSYTKSHTRSVEKIGLKYGKEYGTTKHGHRHAYGQRLSDAKIDPLIIKKSMHHKSIESQIVYTMPSANKVRNELKKASEKLLFESESKITNRGTLGDNLSSIKKYENTDPIELFSGHSKLIVSYFDE